MCCSAVMKLPVLRSGSFLHQHVGRTVGTVHFWVDYGEWMVLRKCGTGVWISFPGPFPCESDAQCLLSETWLCFRPDGPILHLRDAHCPRAQISPSFLFSYLCLFLFFSSIFISHTNPISSSSVLDVSCLAASHFEHHFHQLLLFPLSLQLHIFPLFIVFPLLSPHPL